MSAVLDWLAQRYPALPRFAVGHSLGGQMTGLMPNHGLLSGLVLVFAPEGYVYVSTLKGKLQALLLMGLFIPLTIPLFGYAPVGLLMRAQDLPAGVAWDWMRWTFHFGWIRGVFAKRSEQIYYGEIKAPILALAIEDDSLAPPANCARLLRKYYNGGESELVVLPNSGKQKNPELSHLGYFRRKFSDSHWSQVLSWLDTRVTQREPEALTG
jgi:predicted alpha/beta hydrolase